MELRHPKAKLYIFISILIGTLSIYIMGLPKIIYLPVFIIAGGLLACFIQPHKFVTAIYGKMCLAFFAICFSICAFDIFLRVFFTAQTYVKPHDRFVYRWPAHEKLSRYKAYASFEGKIFGDLAAMSGKMEHRQMRHIIFKTGPHGFRNASPPQAPLDIILLGDSFGMGAGVSQEKRWDHHWQKYNSYNLSIPTSPWGELMNLKFTIPRLPTKEGTLVIWALFVGNDLDEKYYKDSSAKENSWLYQNWIKFKTFRKRSPMRYMFKRISTKSKRVLEKKLDGKPMLFFTPYIERAKRNLKEVEQHKNHTKLQKVFADMKQFIAAKKLKLAVVLIPSKEEIYSWVLNSKKPFANKKSSPMSLIVQKLCQKHQIPYLDLKPQFSQEAYKRYQKNKELLWWRDDTHWNNKGHQVAAQMVYKSLIVPILQSKK